LHLRGRSSCACSATRAERRSKAEPNLRLRPAIVAGATACDVENREWQSTVYSLGSLHVLPADFEWRTPAIQNAIDAADVSSSKPTWISPPRSSLFIGSARLSAAGQTVADKAVTLAAETAMSLDQDIDARSNRSTICAGMAHIAAWTGARAIPTGSVPASSQLLRQRNRVASKLLFGNAAVALRCGAPSAEGRSARAGKVTSQSRRASDKYPGMLAAWSG
jgi:hypothetical protein